MEQISLSHGNGGYHMRVLIRYLYASKLGNDNLRTQYDSAVLPGAERIAMTTDTFTVKPLFFPGGDIGKLAVCGTVNDLIVTGATPKYLTLAFVIEEGFPLADLARIVDSISAEAKANGVTIVTGDTKVVPKGEADGIFINTTGVGFFDLPPMTGVMQTGDSLIVTGDVGRHGAAILLAREGHRLSSALASDVASLLPLSRILAPFRDSIRVMHDPTRGGLLQTLHEFISASGIGIEVAGEAVPVAEQVRGVCELFGFDPLYLACEGRAVFAADTSRAADIVSALRAASFEASVIGTAGGEPKCIMKMPYGVRKQMEEMRDTQLPRIC